MCRRTPTPRPAIAGSTSIVVPSHKLVIVRRGLDFGRQGFDRWDLTREVVKAFAPRDTTVRRAAEVAGR